MTRFALGGKCGRPGKPPLVAAIVPASKLGSSREASAASPMPELVFAKKCRRVSASASARSCAAFNCSIAFYSFVIVSSRFRIMLATVVHAASSGLLDFGRNGDSPTPSSFAASS